MLLASNQTSVPLTADQGKQLNSTPESTQTMGFKVMLTLGLLFAATHSVSAQQGPNPYFYDALALPPTDYDQIFAVDWTGDGKIDLVTYEEMEGVHELTVFEQLEDGTLAPPRTIALPFAGRERPFLYLTDLDGDGKIEIVSPNQDSFTTSNAPIEVFVQDASGNVPGPALPISSVRNWYFLHFDDLNDDGLAEIFAADLVFDTINGGYRSNIWLLSQTSAMTFSEEVKRQDMPVTGPRVPNFTDIDSDGHVDLLIRTSQNDSSDESTVEIYFGSPEFDFQAQSNIPVSDSEQLMAVGDIDADNRIDMVLAGEYDLILAYQNADGTFDLERVVDPRLPNQSVATKITDVDGDGDKDILSFDRSDNRLSTYIQTLSRTFRVEPKYFVNSDPPGLGGGTEGEILIADLNGDNYDDVAVPTLDSPGIGYNRLGSFAVADLALSIVPSYEFRDDGAIITFEVEATNAGSASSQDPKLLLFVAAELEVTGISQPCEYYIATERFELGVGTPATGILCTPGPIDVGARYSVTITTHSTAEGTAETRHEMEGNIEVLGQVDADPSNNLALGSIQGRTGNYSFYDVPYDSLFVNESTEQMIVPVIREGTSLRESIISGLFTDDTATQDDFDFDFGAFPIEHHAGNFGIDRAVVRVFANDGSEGTEQALVRVAAPRPDVYPIDIFVRDDLDDISSNGAMPFAIEPTPYESIQVLPLSSEAIVGVVDDINGDGFDDIAFIEGRRGSDRGYFLEMYLGSPDGYSALPSVTIPRADNGTDLDSGDLNNDGKADLLLTAESGLQIYHDDGNGGLVEGQQIPGPVPTKVVVADLDRNDTDDIVAVRPRVRGSEGIETVFTYLQDESGIVSLSQSIVVPHDFNDPTVAVADVNNDGRPDIITHGDRQVSDLSIILQESDGLYAEPIQKNLTGPNKEFGYSDTYGLTTADIDNDGIDEVLPFGHKAIINGSSAGIEESIDQMIIAREVFFFLPHDMNDDGLIDLVSGGGRTRNTELPAIRFQLQNGQFHLVAPPSFNGELLVNNNFQEPWVVSDFNDDGAPDVMVISVAENAHTGPVNAYIGYNWPFTMNMSTSIRNASGNLGQGGRGSLIVRVSNDSDRNADESLLVLNSSTNARISDAYAAAGTCGQKQSDTRHAGCMLPILEPGGFVDIKVSYEAAGSGAASVTATIEGRAPDESPADNASVHEFSISAPAPPPPKRGGGGGSLSLGLIWLIVLTTIHIARRANFTRYLRATSGRSCGARGGT